MATELKCDYCGAPATIVHVLPWADETAERVELTGKCDCDPDGYWFRLREWTDGPPDWDDPSRKYTKRRHLEDSKSGSERVLALVNERLGLAEK